MQSPSNVARYSLRGSTAHRESLTERTASAYAGFFSPQLAPGMRVLDCGCGPGSITLDLADFVPRGQVIGIDIGPHEIEVARALAAERDVVNVHFAVANVFALPFADRSIDAVFAHTLFMHISDHQRALREIRRVLRPGGVFGLSDTYFVPAVWEPHDPLFDQFLALLRRVLAHNGGSPDYMPHQRTLLREAGFHRTESSAIVEQGGQGSAESTRRGATYVNLLLRDAVRETALAQGWADAETLDAMAAALTNWGEHPDAFYVGVVCQTLGWV